MAIEDIFEAVLTFNRAAAAEGVKAELGFFIQNREISDDHL